MIGLRSCAALGLAAVLGACAQIQPTAPPPCPPLGTPDPLDRGTVFRAGAGTDLTDVIARHEILELASVCDYDDDGVEVTMRVSIVTDRGPAETGDSTMVEYFVAVENGPGNITAKSNYKIEMPYGESVKRIGRTEELDVFIPVPPNNDYSEVKILVGLQLTKEQVDYNRRNPLR